ncbi:endonuclease/exonuclease/phosphatase family protein [Salinarimonas chemoclinalis]|uniref:endonuclease/exonuclease/phosphatase family protein n=1 Tax=Salinarimonas chemoclinalis TaxID=3241599 RepID=UPI0035576091
MSNRIVPNTILVLSGLWLLWAVLHEALTGRFWLWVIPGMAPPILFAAIPALLLLAGLFAKRRRLPVVAIALAAFAVSHQSTGINYRALLPRDAAVASPASIRVVQMNTDYWGQMRDGTLTDPRDRDAMLAYLRALDADVYLLQEHMLRDGDLAIPVDDFSDLEAAFPEYAWAKAGTLLTLSRLPIVARAVVNADSDSDIFLPPPPYALRVDVRAGDAVMSTYNVHMPVQLIIEDDWFGARFYTEIRRRHYIRKDEFDVLTADVAGNPNPLVVAGDFNTSPAMGDNRRLLAVTRDAAATSGILYPATWRVGGQLPKLWRNDWFLVGNAMRVDRFRSLDPEGNSDHLVQVVDMTAGGG